MKSLCVWKRLLEKLQIQIGILMLCLGIIGCGGAKMYPEQGYEVQHFGGNIFGGGFKFRITETYWSEKYLGATPKNKYLIIKTAITNPKNTPAGFESKYTLVFRLVSKQGTKYAPEVTSGEFGIGNNINPNESVEGVIVFDVPTGDYALETAIYDTYKEKPDLFDRLIKYDPRKGESFQHPLNPTQK